MSSSVGLRLDRATSPWSEVVSVEEAKEWCPNGPDSRHRIDKRETTSASTMTNLESSCDSVEALVDFGRHWNASISRKGPSICSGTRNKLSRASMEQELFLEAVGESAGYCVSEIS